MATARIEYLGDLQTKCTHVKSGSTFVTDAPVDNNGKGSAFSPTDTLATAYVSCMITIIGIYCDQNDIPFMHCVGEVNKIMASGPRRVAALEISIDLSGNDWTDEQRAKIIRAGENCPVAKSVSDAMEISISYKY